MSNEDIKVKEAIYTKKKRHFSTVWIVPIVALLIGLSLVYNSISQKGPTIKIVFKSAEGIKAGKSVIKYKDIEVGKVKDVSFSPDLKSVIVTAEIKKNMKSELSENTKFWIVHARLSVNAVEGLDTLLSGAYIAMKPAKGKKFVKEFKGLQEPPIVKDSTKGKHFILEAYDKGSIQIGSPVYYKKIPAGSVTGYKLSENGRFVFIDVFIKEPFSNFVTDKTRFWNASGIDASITANGVDIRTESMTSILIGGIAFDNFDIFGKGEKVKNNYHFTLFKDLKTAQKVTYNRELFFWVYFNESIRGLKPGSAVEFRGVKIGEVVNFFLIGNMKTASFKIPILIKIEPERFTLIGTDNKKRTGNEVNEKIFTSLIKKGFRAQLQSASLITGELLINLDFYPNAPKVKIKRENGLFVIPSVPATMESLKSNLQSILDRISSIPFEDIGKRIDNILKQIDTKTVPNVNSSINSINKDILPEFRKLIHTTNYTIEGIETNYIKQNSPLQRNILNLLNEISKTSQSIKSLTNYLERHPESLIRGR